MYDLIYHHVIIKLGGGNVPELDNLLLLFLFLVSFLLSFEKAWKIFISLVILLSSNHLSAWVCCVCPGTSQSPRLTHTFLFSAGDSAQGRGSAVPGFLPAQENISQAQGRVSSERHIHSFLYSVKKKNKKNKVVLFCWKWLFFFLS